MQQPTSLRHRGRIFRLLALPLLAIGFTVLLAFQTTSPDPDIQAAQNWFASNYPTPSFMGVSVTPNWALARKVTAPSGSLYFEVPLNQNIQSNIGNADGGTLDQTETAAVNGSLTLVVELYNSTYAALYFRVAATRNYVNANGKAAVLQTKFDQVQSNFSGVLEYFTMESQSLKGIFVENGVPTKFVRTQQQLAGQVEDRCVQTDTWTIFYAISGGGSSMPVFDVLSTSHTTMFSPDCFDQPMLPDDYAEGLSNAYWGNQGNNSPVSPPPPPPPPPPVIVCFNYGIPLGNYPFGATYMGTCHVSDCKVQGEVLIQQNGAPQDVLLGYVSIVSSSATGELIPNQPSGPIPNGNSGTQSVPVLFTWTAQYTQVQNPFYTGGNVLSTPKVVNVTFNNSCCQK